MHFYIYIKLISLSVYNTVKLQDFNHALSNHHSKSVFMKFPLS